MRARVVALALPVAIGIGVAVTACGGSSGTAKPAASDGRPASGTASPAADATAPGQGGPAAAGYARIGGPAQGISVEAPKSWVAVNLAKESIEKAAQRVALKGLSASTVAQAMESLQKMHGVVVFDVKTAESNPQHYSPNLSAYCTDSGVTDTGAGGVPLLKETMADEFANSLHATHITQKELTIGGVPGLRTSYQVTSSAIGTAYGSQLEVLPKADKACFVTLTTLDPRTEDAILGQAATTAQFP